MVNNAKPPDLCRILLKDSPEALEYLKELEKKGAIATDSWLYNPKHDAFRRILEEKPPFVKQYLDDATGLPNWDAYLDFAQHALEDARSLDMPLSLSYMRFDKLADYLRPPLESIEDKFDRRNMEIDIIGDLVAQVYSVIGRHTRPDYDFVFRMDPKDHDLVSDLLSIVHKSRKPYEAVAIAESIRADIENVQKESANVLTVSIGVTGFEGRADTRPLVNLDREASDYLTRAKGHGNCIFYKGFKTR